MYWMCFIGGIVYFVGFLMLGWNFLMIVCGGKFVEIVVEVLV